MAAQHWAQAQKVSWSLFQHIRLGDFWLEMLLLVGFLLEVLSI
ncbi:hypothetical protein SOHN41_03378 [Shewanella sp. HN-41]|nr:hypothetical protein SOHN41_03378 [Shewanella sp. HN-41]